jgi:ATP-dependent RNA helicase DDX18/HAS1
VQYDPPLDIKEYIHRVGRTCRGASAKGKALLFLLEEERGYLKHLLQAKVQLNEYEFEDSKLEDVQEEFEMLVSKNSYLHGEALCAFKSYLHAYTTYNLKEVFNVHALDLSKVALSFGLAKAPHVDLSTSSPLPRPQAGRRQNQEAQGAR